MLLFVLRHGKAGEGYPDEVRELTARGREDVASVINRRAEIFDSLEKIQASSLVRAQQTAQIVKACLAFEGAIETNDSLTPWGSPTELLNSLNDEVSATLLASHQPFVSELVEHLTGERIAMPTSALVAIEMEYPAEGGGRLLWVETP